MKIVQLAPLMVTVALDPEDCCAIAAALADQDEDCCLPLNRALASGLLAGAYTAFLLGDEDPPRTLASFWARWAPEDTSADPPRRIPMPGGLPDTDTRHLERGEAVKA